MKRYIDADAFIKEIVKIQDLRRLSTATIGEALDRTPTADVVEVVRCKDCEFWQTDWIPNTGGDRGCHYCEMMDSFTEPLNYCGYAERKILPKN